MVRRAHRMIAIMAGTFAFPASAHVAADADRLSAELIHSDVPLFGSRYRDRWPQSFMDGDGFGCTSRVGFGDWKLEPTRSDDDPSWFRIVNYGVFHCFARIAQSGERDRLARTDSRVGSFLLLGTATKSGGRKVELWAMQIGARPGSDYILLSREPKDGIITEFTVLQRACGKRDRRSGPQMDILLTHYCAVNARSELKRLAKDMARRPPLGTLRRIADAARDD